MRCLAAMCHSARTPALIKEAERGFGGDASASGGEPGILDQLTSWLRHAALRAAVESSLAAQGGAAERAAAPDALTAGWTLTARGRPLGTLEATGDRLLWRGPPLPGVSGPQLGRRQLDTLVAAALATAV